MIFSLAAKCVTFLGVRDIQVIHMHNVTKTVILQLSAVIHVIPLSIAANAAVMACIAIEK